eukprot:64131-Rhodomonas_salina.2
MLWKGETKVDRLYVLPTELCCQRRKLPQHPHQPARSLITNPVPAQVKTSQHHQLLQRHQQPWKFTSLLPLQRDHHVLGQAPKVLRKATVNKLCLCLLHNKYAPTVVDQIPSKLLASQQTNNHPLSRLELPQHSW